MSRDEIDMHAPVAQLDRALDSDSKGRWFESSRAYQKDLFFSEEQVFFHSCAGCGGKKSYVEKYAGEVCRGIREPLNNQRFQTSIA